MEPKPQNLPDFIFSIANKLRGPYRPPQYRKVMLPLVVLRRLDSVLEGTKEAVLAEYKKLLAQEMPEPAIHTILAKKASPNRQQPYNVSKFSF